MLNLTPRITIPIQPTQRQLSTTLWSQNLSLVAFWVFKRVSAFQKQLLFNHTARSTKRSRKFVVLFAGTVFQCSREPCPHVPKTLHRNVTDFSPHERQTQNCGFIIVDFHGRTQVHWKLTTQTCNCHPFHNSNVSSERKRFAHSCTHAFSECPLQTA